MVDLEEPDKGRAWLIAFAACIINTILSGISRMVGILYVAVIDTYGVKREQATLPFIIRNSVRCLSGPLVGLLGERFGIRAVTFWGGVLACLGATLCSVAPSVIWLCFFWGGMHGLGFALANTLFQVVVNQYFHKYRATASGIALSGACVGSLAFPFMVEAILDTYGLNGGFLILGGIVMNVLPPALLMKSPQWVEYPKAYARLYAKKLKETNNTSETGSSSALFPMANGEAEDRKMARTTSLSNCPIESVDVYRTSRRSRQMERDMGVFKGGPSFGNRKTLSDSTAVRCTAFRRRSSPTQRNQFPERNQFSHSLEPNRTDGKSSITEFYNSMSDQSVESYEMSVEIQSSLSEPIESSPATKTVTLWENMLIIARLYLNPMYVLISLSMTCYVLIFIPTLTVLVDYSKDKGISTEYGKHLINSMAIGDLIGRLCFGWVTDRHVLTLPRFVMLILTVQGLSVVVFPFAGSLYAFMASLVFYSVTAGCLIVIFPVLVHEYVDADKQSLGMACIGFVSGLFSFGTPPTIGYFRDHVGSYDGMFFISGGISILCGLLWNFESLLTRYYPIKKDSDIESNANIFENGLINGPVNSQPQSISK